MKSFTRITALTTAVLIAVSFTIAGCSSSKNPSENAPAGESTEDAAKTGGGTAEGEPTKITMFFGDAGIGFGEDVDPDDNDFIKVFEKAANVDVEMIVPTYQEFQTKFNLMMSSGDIPDLVHCWFKADVDRYGIEGAFKNWKDVLPKSSVLKTYYPDDALKLMETTDGGIYALNVLSNGTVSGQGVRIDLVNEVNGGVMPKTPDDWYQFFKKIKAKYPDAVPCSPNNGKNFYRANTFFYAYGIQPWDLQTETADGTEYFWCLENKNMKAAVEFYKKLYDEGLLYKEFATIQGDTHENLMNTKKLALYETDEGNLTATQQRIGKPADTSGVQPDKSAIWVFAPTPVAPGVDIREAQQGKYSPLGYHCVAINSKCDDNTTAAVLRFLEALADKKLLDTCVWGREGIEYNTVNGERVINQEANQKTSYRLAYQFFRTYYYSESMEFRIADSRSAMTDEQKAVYDKAYPEGLKTVQDEFNLNPPVVPKDFVSLPDLAPKLTEANDKTHEIVYKAIMGEITMDQFDEEVKAFVNKYQGIKDTYNTEIKKFIK